MRGRKRKREGEEGGRYFKKFYRDIGDRYRYM